MSPTLLAGIVMGILVEIWTYLMGFTGWYKDPSKVALFWVVILIEIAVLVWGLRMTAARGNGYGRQILAGLGMSVVGAAIILLGGYIFSAIVFPTYFDDINAIRAAQWAERGIPKQQIDQMLALGKPLQSPFVNALIGAVMAVVTGLLSSLVIAAFVRKKKA